MLTVYHKIPLVERSPRLLNVLEMVSLPNVCAFAGSFAIKVDKIFLFICRFPSVEDGPGGTYLSGQSPDPASRRHLRMDRSTLIGRSFSEFRTCCVGQSCASSIRESSRTEECAVSSKTRDLGGQSTSIKAASVRRWSQII